MEYILNLTNFSGPIDLLFYSVKKGETDIYNISLSEIITQYIQHIQELLEIDLEKVAEFLLYSSALLEIKSKKLLPSDEEEEEEEISEEELKKLLEERMEEYRKYKEVSESFKIWEENMRKIYFRKGGQDLFKDMEDILLEDISLVDLFISFKKILERSKERFLEIRPDPITVEDKIEEIKIKFNDKKAINFLELFSEDATKIEVIVTFLAVLELIKKRIIKIRQSKIFGEIEIYLVDGKKSI